MNGEPEWKWLESTRRLQQESFGVTSFDRSPEELADSISENLLALFTEVGEAAQEFQWKKWAKNRGTMDRAAFLGELVDAGHFMGNLLIAIGVDDEEWERAYRAKQDRNRARQAHADGYDAKASKCPGCHRELDKPKALVRQVALAGPALADVIARTLCVSCANCGQRLGTRLASGETKWLPGIDIPGLSEASYTDG